MATTFVLNAQKAIEAIVYLAAKKPNMTQYYFMKMMFYADKYHLNMCGMPIIGDKYIKMANGPVPSFVLDAIHLDDSKLTPEICREIEASLSFKQYGRRIFTSAKRAPNVDFLSASDIECLDKAFDFCKDKTFDELKDLTHEETAWKSAQDNRTMDYTLFIDSDNPEKDAIISEMQDSFGTLVL